MESTRNIKDLTPTQTAFQSLISQINQFIKEMPTNDLLSNKNGLTELLQSLLIPIYKLLGNDKDNGQVTDLNQAILTSLYNKTDLPDLEIDAKKFKKNHIAVINEISEAMHLFYKTHALNNQLLDMIRNTIYEIKKPSSVRNWPISEDLVYLIFTYLSTRELGNIAQVCTEFRRIADDNSLWKEKLRNEIPDYEALLELYSGLISALGNTKNSYKETFKLVTDHSRKCYLVCDFDKNSFKHDDVGYDILENWWELQKSKLTLHETRQEAIEAIKKQYDYQFNRKFLLNFNKLNKHLTKRVFIIEIAKDITFAKNQLQNNLYYMLRTHCFAIQEYNQQTKKFLNVILIKFNTVSKQFEVNDRNTGKKQSIKFG